MIFGRHERELESALADLNPVAQPGGMMADQARRDEVAEGFVQADRLLCGLDGLIYIAAVPGDTKKNNDEWEYVIGANILEAMWCCEEAVPPMKKRGCGRIVNIGSLSAKPRGAGTDVYVATKSVCPASQRR